MKNMNKVDLTKLKSKVKGRPLYFCKCGLSKRLPYCDGRHGCDGPANENKNGGGESGSAAQSGSE